MKTPQTRLDKEQIAEKEALQHKSFKNLLSAHNESTVSSKGNNGLKIIVGAFAVAILGLIYISKTESHTPETTSERIASIEKPFPQSEESYESYTINATEHNCITTNNGCIITIPENALVNSKGKYITDSVVLKYREFRDMIDVFLSGIPMTYDSAGTQYHFESAGMFELNAFQNNKPVYLDHTKEITVQFASDYTGNQYNIYNFDLKNQEWEYMYKDSDIITTEAADEGITHQFENLDKQIESITKAIPEAPTKLDPSNINIKIDVLEEQFPEIAVYQNVQFQIIDTKDFDPSLSDLEWDAVKVLLSDEDTYLIHFERGKDVQEFECVPVFAGSDYTKAKQVFKKVYDSSMQQLEVLNKKKKAIQSKYSRELISQRNSLTNYKAGITNGNSTASSERNVMRIFAMKSFGIYNSDCPKNLPQGEMIALKLRDTSETNPDKFLDIKKVYLVEKNKNALYTYYSLDHFSYNPNSQNTIWAVTKDNKLAVYHGSEFTRTDDGTDIDISYVCNMAVINVNFNNPLEIRKYLEI